MWEAREQFVAHLDGDEGLRLVGWDALCCRFVFIGGFSLEKKREMSRWKVEDFFS